jgi:phosphonate transport system substrate-binding protein
MKTQRPSFALCLLAAGLLLLLAAPAATGDEKEDKREKIERERDLIMAVHPYLPAGEVYSRFHLLADFLSEKLGRNVVLEISSDYEDHIERVGLGDADIAYMGPAAYVEMTERYGRKPLAAMLEVRGRTSLRGVIFVNEDSRIRHLPELAGKRFAFGDPHSTMSHIVPRYMLLMEGVPAEALAGYDFLTNHENVALGVLYGDYDAGAVKQEVFEEFRIQGLEAIAWTPPVAEHVIVLNDQLTSELRNRIREALLSVTRSKEGPSIMFAIKSSATGFAPASDHDFNNLRQIMRVLDAAGAMK